MLKMLRKEYRLYRRKTVKENKHIYYVVLYDPEGKEYRISTGCSSKGSAVRWIEKHIDAVKSHREIKLRRDHDCKLRDYVENFWDYEGVYAESRRARLWSIGKSYLAQARGITKNHLIPKWGDYYLKEIIPADIDEWVVSLVKGGKLAPRSINMILRTLSTVLQQAANERRIPENPASPVPFVRIEMNRRKILNRTELNDLIGDPDIWDDYRHFAINLLALTTGMRIGEIQGLQLEHIFSDHITVRKCWSRLEGLKEPKQRSIRDIPISKKLHEVLLKVIHHTRPQSYVFFGNTYDSPIGRNQIIQALYKAYEKIGIDEQERKERKLDFHAHRHCLHTLLRSAGVPDHKIRIIAGHRSPNMTELYTHFRYEDFREVVTIQEDLVPDYEQ